MVPGPTRPDSAAPLTCRVDDGKAALQLSGPLTLARGAELWTGLRRELRALPAGAALEVDLTGVSESDGGGAALLREVLIEERRAGRAVALRGGPPDLVDRLGTLDPGPEAMHAAPGRPSGFDQVGRVTLELVDYANGMLDFVGDTVAAARYTFRRRGGVDWSEVPRLVERHGVDSVPIVALISFLVGLTLAFQSARQLKLYGADVFVADLVAISMLREMGPLMTAIVMAGRSGAGIAAELGTMAVNEEIDALRTLGLDPHRRLVLPRVFALSFAVPALALVSMVVGVVGGAMIGLFYLGINITTWSTETVHSLHISDLTTGLMKAFVFGLTISMIACQRGLATRGGAEGVGRSTTGSVVAVLFLLVVLDSLLTILFQVWGI
jgi:phospholipid/cholesterol/gamma-HCH transport system permease protein